MSLAFTSPLDKQRINQLKYELSAWAEKQNEMVREEQSDYHARAQKAELEAIEIEKIFENVPITFFNNYETVFRVYSRIQKRFGSMASGLQGVFLLGHIYGVRTERKRRKKANKN